MGLRTFLCLSCLALTIVCNAECRKAKSDDLPHGANTLIELKEQRLSQIFGTLRFPNGELAGDIVVEVYLRAGAQSLQEARQQGRLAACVTSADGRFYFAGLKPGKYWVFAGTRKEAGVNEISVPIILRKSWLGRKGQGIRFILVLGT